MTPEGPRRRLPLVAIGAAIVLVLAGAGLALVLAQSGGGGSATGPGIGLLPTAPASAPLRSTSAATAPAAANGSWPVGSSAWTVVIASVSKKRHTRAAVERVARKASLPDMTAGVLDSSQHPLLRPALWIVFAGRYATRSQAERMQRRLEADGTERTVVERLTG